VSRGIRRAASRLLWSAWAELQRHGKDFPSPRRVSDRLMRVERAAATASLVDVLDRVLDKGIVIDAWVRVSLIGIELVTVEARVVVASIATYLGYSDLLAQTQAIPHQTLHPPRGTASTLPTWTAT
jgi:hypothetical protein